MAEPVPPPPGCWRALLSIPVLIVALRLFDPWSNFLFPILTPRMSETQATEVIGFTGLLILLVLMQLVYGAVDLVFGSRLSWFRWAAPAADRARLRVRGLYVVAGVIALDQGTKFMMRAFVHRPASLFHFLDIGANLKPDDVIGTDPDQDLIVLCAALIVILWGWYWPRNRAWSVLSSLILGAALSNGADLLLSREVPAPFRLHAFGTSTPPFNIADIAMMVAIPTFLLLYLADTFRNAARDVGSASEKQ
ncbi:MAG: signal peptidase II [Rhizomicrobium sp.]|jgi:lipoprotein signal peptidase